jgi:hypothetical protein
LCGDSATTPSGGVSPETLQLRRYACRQLFNKGRFSNDKRLGVRFMHAYKLQDEVPFHPLPPSPLPLFFLRNPSLIGPRTRVWP